MEALQRALERQPRIAYALLFGSGARGSARADSDLDLAVGLTPGSRLEPHELGDLVSTLEQATDRTIDLLVLDEAPPAVVYRVFRDGDVILSRDHSAPIERKTRAILEYLDFRPLEELAVRGVLAAVEEPQVGLVHDLGRPQRLGAGREAHLVSGHPAERLVDQGHQAVEGRLVATAPAPQQGGDRSGFGDVGGHYVPESTPRPSSGISNAPSAVDVLPVPDGVDADAAGRIVHLVEDAAISDADAVSLPRRELASPGRARIISKMRDRLAQPSDGDLRQGR